jgi:hypothetical protein
MKSKNDIQEQAARIQQAAHDLGKDIVVLTEHGYKYTTFGYKIISTLTRYTNNMLRYIGSDGFNKETYYKKVPREIYMAL